MHGSEGREEERGPGERRKKEKGKLPSLAAGKTASRSLFSTTDLHLHAFNCHQHRAFLDDVSRLHMHLKSGKRCMNRPHSQTFIPMIWE